MTQKRKRPAKPATKKPRRKARAVSVSADRPGDVHARRNALIDALIDSFKDDPRHVARRSALLRVSRRIPLLNLKPGDDVVIDALRDPPICRVTEYSSSWAKHLLEHLDAMRIVSGPAEALLSEIASRSGAKVKRRTGSYRVIGPIPLLGARPGDYVSVDLMHPTRPVSLVRTFGPERLAGLEIGQLQFVLGDDVLAASAPRGVISLEEYRSRRPIAGRLVLAR